MNQESLNPPDSVTRRFFVRKSVILAGALTSFCSDKMISFDEAIGNHRDRTFGQRYIDQLVLEVLREQAPLVFDSVTYDVNNELMEEAHRHRILEEIADPRSFEEFRRKLPRYRNLYESAMQLLESDPRFAGYSPTERRSRATAYLQTDEALTMLKKRFDRARVSLAENEDMKSYNASTTYNKYNFASGKKSRCFVSGRYFRQEVLQYREVSLMRPLTEQWIRVGLAHEYGHGLNFKNGIRLSPDLVIDNDNRIGFDDKAFDFVDESMHLVEDLKVLRKISDVIDRQNLYVYALLATYIKCQQEYAGLTQERQLTDFERRFVAHQDGVLNNALADLPRLFRGLGIPGNVETLSF